MSRQRAVVVLAAAAAFVLTPASRADHNDPSAPIVSYTLSGTAGANGWFTSNVTIAWSAADPEGHLSAPCPITQLVTAEGTTEHTCTATSHGGTTTGRVILRIDKTPPVVSGATAARGPDANGWYNHPVAVAFAGADAVSGIASCTSATYGGGDGASVSVSGTCTDAAGHTSAPGSFSLAYDATPPEASAAPDRAPDTNGWYRRPLTVSFGGSDGGSGVESCTPARTYSGPDAGETTVTGACRDRAGNTSQSRAFTFKYDATPPRLSGVEATYVNGVAQIEWRRPGDTRLVRIDRVPGVNGAARTNVYRGTGQLFRDRTVRPGVRYRYEFIVLDVAGNVASSAVALNARPPLYAPTAGTRVRAPVVLRWERAPRARFYNVQLFRGKVKVLTAWPSTTHFRLPARWRFSGRQHALTAGSYRWFVWPAPGTRERPRYGRPLGSSTFRVP